MTGAVSAFAALWAREFRAVAPAHLVEALSDAPHPTICLLRPGDDGLTAELRDGTRVIGRAATPEADLSRDGIDRFVRTTRRARDVRCGLAIAPTACFRRTFDMPEQALHKITEVLSTELARKTPFRPADVHTGHHVLARADGRVTIEQLVVKKSVVERALAPTRLTPSDLSFLEIRFDDDAPRRIDLAGRTEPRRAPRTFLVALAASALLFVGVHLGLLYIAQERRLVELDALLAGEKTRLAETRARADKAVAARDAQTQFRALQAAPRLIDAWSELTRLLPDDCWLSELRFSEGAEGAKVLNLTGLSASAADLVRLLETSPAFGDTALTAAVTHDPQERRERFSLQTVSRPAPDGTRGAP